MNYEDLFKPYTPEIRGELIEYLRQCEQNGAANLFYGPEHYIEMKDKELLMPGISFVRVSLSPAPDLGYLVNEQHLLESTGEGKFNMSLISAEKGVHNPEEALKNQNWSISWLRL